LAGSGTVQRKTIFVGGVSNPDIRLSERIVGTGLVPVHRGFRGTPLIYLVKIFKTHAKKKKFFRY
jgi:hypothetical protein